MYICLKKVTYTKWYKDKKIHRRNLPAIVMVDGTKCWYFEGKRHRLDGPALIRQNGFMEWYSNGILHRDNDDPAIIYSDSSSEYWYKGRIYELVKSTDMQMGCRLNNKVYFNQNESVLHSYKDSPSVAYFNGTKEWHKEGLLHRKNAPAIEYPNGDIEYWNRGERHRTDGPAVVIGGKQYFFEYGEFIKCIV